MTFLIPDRARKNTELYSSGSLVKKKIFAGSLYELEEDASGNKRHLYYVPGPGGEAAIFVKVNSGTVTPYYIHKDHQGTYQTITNSSGATVETLSFDPWGRRRNPVNWTYIGVPASFTFDRGYTGHEHLDVFSLINMNGRIYDPATAHFLSPDNYVQNPNSTQSYHRYGYCLNNPLKYKDPTGYKLKLGLLDFMLLYDPIYAMNRLAFKENQEVSLGESITNLTSFDIPYTLYIKYQDNKSKKTEPTEPKPSRTTGEDPYSMPCFSQEGDVILQGFPDQFDAQNNPNICFTTSMEYLSIFYGGTRRREEYGSYYMMSNQDLSYYSRGITDLQKGKTLLSTFFNIQEISPQEITKSIDAGNPVMTTIYTGSTVENGETIENYHSVVIIGYNYNDCTYIIVDPYTGQWARVTASSVEDKNLYAYQIYGMKPE